MTSRRWKDRREKEDFMARLKEFRDETVLAQDLDPAHETFAEAIERQYWEDYHNGFFEDDEDDWYADGLDDDWDYDPYDDAYEDDREYEFHASRHRWDVDDDWRSDNGEYRLRPGNHVRAGDATYLVLDTGAWANLLTGRVQPGQYWVDKEQVVFGL